MTKVVVEPYNGCKRWQRSLKLNHGVFVICVDLCNYLLSSFVDFAGFPKDGHQEKGRTVKTSEREIWNQHRPSKVAFW